MDGFSVLLILLTTLMGAIAVLSSWTAITERVKEFYIFMLVLQTGMLGAFVSLDFLLFFLFWEVMLVPMYFLIGIWGGGRRLYSAIKFFIYTLVGSVVMLLGILALYFHNHAVTGTYSFDIDAVPAAERALRAAEVDLPRVLPRVRDQGPDVPVPHLAARRAHGCADGRLGDPRGRSAEDGHVRLHPLQPADPARCVALLRAARSSACRSSASSTARSSRWRRPTGSGSSPIRASATWRWSCSACSRMTPVGITGSIIQQINHGISTGALFLIVGIVYERRHTREISDYGGLSKVMPVFAAVFLIMTMSSIGLPALNGFIGEVLILQGVFVVNKMWAGVAAAGIVLGAAYMLWLYQRTMFGKIDNPANAALSDLSLREVVMFAPLLMLAFWIGLYPAPFLRRLETSVGRVVARVNSVYAPVVAQGADCKTAAPVPPPPVAGMPPGIGLVAPCDDGVAKPEASKASRPNGEHR